MMLLTQINAHFYQSQTGIPMLRSIDTVFSMLLTELVVIEKSCQRNSYIHNKHCNPLTDSSHGEEAGAGGAGPGVSVSVG